MPIRSINDFKRKYFPKAFAKEERERKIKKHGFGKVIADEVIESMKKLELVK